MSVKLSLSRAECVLLVMIGVVLFALLIPTPQASFSGLRSNIRENLCVVSVNLLRAVESDDSGEFSESLEQNWRMAVVEQFSKLEGSQKDLAAVEMSHWEAFRRCGRVRRESEVSCWVIRRINFPGSVWDRLRVGDFVPDGAENTVLLVAVADDGRQWFEVGDPSLDDVFRPPYFGDRSCCRGLVVALADGSALWLPPSLSRSELEELVSADGSAERSAGIIARIHAL